MPALAKSSNVTQGGTCAGSVSRFCSPDRGLEGLQRLELRRGSECFRWCCGVSFRSFSARLVRGNKQRADLLPKTPRAGGGSPTRRNRRAERQRRAARNGTK